jgi:hypothetical protein
MSNSSILMTILLEGFIFTFFEIIFTHSKNYQRKLLSVGQALKKRICVSGFPNKMMYKVLIFLTHSKYDIRQVYTWQCVQANT